MKQIKRGNSGVIKKLESEGKRNLSDEIARKTADFEAKGGSVTIVKNGVSGAVKRRYGVVGQK